MNLNQLQYFHQIAKSENMSRTAGELNVSQSSLSVSLRKLEEELGLTLFDRAGRSLKLNANGRRFYQDVDDMLSLLAPLHSGTDASSHPEELVIYTDITQSWLDIPLMRYTKEHPDILLHVCTAQTLRNMEGRTKIRELLRPVFFLASSPRRADGCKSVRLCEKSYSIVMSARNPFAVHEDLQLTDLIKAQFIFCMPETQTTGPGYRLCEEAGFSPEIVCFADDRWVMLSLIEASAALVTIMPTPDAARLENSSTFHVVPFSRPAGAKKAEVWISFREEDLDTPAKRELIDIVLSSYRILEDAD
ncbi:MAG: LysR family transcriptional regulator [Clostridium sp.]|nr:LysR family transcriptional regulator [Clostridium sp.]